MQLNKINHG